MTSSLSKDLFSQFFHGLWGYSPFPWQEDFAERLCTGQSVDYVTVPTGSGKTACLDAAVFALAVQSFLPLNERTASRRIFFIVNRRIIVDEAFDRAQKIVHKLRHALNNKEGIVYQVAIALQKLAGGDGETPLTCAELRGGVYRDRSWVKSILQPMILCSTVDQAGSRLLFRGYGVSPEARPIHAALLAQDSLLLIDEAHISQPFLQTLDWVKRYRVHQPQGAHTVHLPFSIVRMTATPPKHASGTTQLALSQQDLEHPILSRRLNASKPVRLVHAAKAKGRAAADELVKALESETSNIISKAAPKSIAVMVNRVATARLLAEALKKKHTSAETTLLIGRMRPLDRDHVTKHLQSLLKTGTQPKKEDKLQIVVSTQCLEVGADLDFDALVSECASLDALRQRFGRLNRDGRPIEAQGVIVIPESQKIEESKLSEDKPLDPIYGNSVPRTWRWLENIATDGIVDFGLKVMTSAIADARNKSEGEATFSQLLMPRADAPVLLPAYLDCLVQTNPAPAVEPDVSIFLHGPQRDMAEVQVCWRADLPDDLALWKDVVSFCPPTTLECLSVPLSVMRDYLTTGKRSEDSTGDSPATAEEEDRKPQKEEIKTEVSALCWLDEKSFPINSTKLVAGQTIILREQDKAWQHLGHIPEASSKRIDSAELGQSSLRRRAYVRLHENIWWPEGAEESPAGKLKKWAKATSSDVSSKEDFDLQPTEVKEILLALASEPSTEALLAERLKFLAQKKVKLVSSRYPDNTGVSITSYALLPIREENEMAIAEDGPDDPLLENSRKQSLDDHTNQVVELADHYAKELGANGLRTAISAAAQLHDSGKADPRFQAMLIQGTVAAAYAQPKLWAKSNNIPNSAKAREQIRLRAGLPKGYRHEMLSLHLTTLNEAVKRSEDYSLVLHLIASHHGHARPFAPVVNDEDPPAITLESDAITLTSEDRLSSPAHAIDSGVSERFWQLTRHHGWWGLALLESILRLADQKVSANPEASSPQ